MDLAEAGERRIVAALRETCGHAEPEDDCARLPVGDRTLLLTTDVAFEPTHLPDPMTDRQRGRYVAAVNLSDLAACGAEPRALLLAMGLPETLDLDDVEAIARGAADLAEQAGCRVEGGDTKPAETLTLAGFAVGEADHDGMPRAAARPGQVLAVTGRLGGAGRDLAAWRDGAEDDLDALISPTPRLAEGRALARAGATACMDLSDGLAYSLHRLAEAAGCGFAVDATALPRADDATREHVLFAGGDFELLASVPEDRWPAARDAVDEAGGELTRIGDVVDGGVTLDGEPLADRGVEHFAGSG